MQNYHDIQAPQVLRTASYFSGCDVVLNCSLTLQDKATSRNFYEFAPYYIVEFSAHVFHKKRSHRLLSSPLTQDRRLEASDMREIAISVT